MSETTQNTPDETTTDEKEIVLNHQEAIDRQTLIDAGFAKCLEQNSQGQPIDVQINVIGLLAAIVRVLSRTTTAPKGDTQNG